MILSRLICCCLNVILCCDLSCRASELDCACDSCVNVCLRWRRERECERQKEGGGEQHGLPFFWWAG